MGSSIGIIKCGRVLLPPNNGSMKNEINKHIDNCVICQSGNIEYRLKKIKKLIINK